MSDAQAINAGAATAMLENALGQMSAANAVMKEAGAEIQRLRRLNAVLLGACKVALPFLEAFDYADYEGKTGGEAIERPMIAQVRAAIAEAEAV